MHQNYGQLHQTSLPFVATAHGSAIPAKAAVWRQPMAFWPTVSLPDESYKHFLVAESVRKIKLNLPEEKTKEGWNDKDQKTTEGSKNPRMLKQNRVFDWEQLRLLLSIGLTLILSTMACVLVTWSTTLQENFQMISHFYTIAFPRNKVNAPVLGTKTKLQENILRT